MVLDPIVVPLHLEPVLHSEGMIHLGDTQYVPDINSHIHIHRINPRSLPVELKGRDLLVVVVLDDQYLALVLVTLVITVWGLITPLLYINTLSVVTGEHAGHARGELDVHHLVVPPVRAFIVLHTFHVELVLPEKDPRLQRGAGGDARVVRPVKLLID